MEEKWYGRAVKVDVAVVAKDYLASELIGSSFSMTKTKRSDRWATLSSTRRKHFAILRSADFSAWVGVSSQFPTIA